MGDREVVRCGILLVLKTIAEFARHGMPPDHRITAVRARPGGYAEDWLIEGPDMPECDPLAPRSVSILFATQTTEGGDMRHTGKWTHGPDRSWPIAPLDPT